MVLIKQRIAQLEKENKELRKYKLCKGKRIQQEGIVNFGVGLQLIALELFRTQVSQKRARSSGGIKETQPS